MASTRDISPNRLLNSLLIPGILPAFMGWIFTVSLPVIRDEFRLNDDTTSWLVIGSSLVFLVMVPFYGRLSDGLGKRRLILIGMTISIVGTFMVLFSQSVFMILMGRVVQSIGVASIVPLSIALISETFSKADQGKALGTWATGGPVAGVLAPLIAGAMIDRFGWRITFLPAAIIAVIGLVSVFFFIPSSKKSIQTAYLRTFDWIGFGLLFATLTSLLLFVSSRAVTGVAPLRDWRLLGLFIFFLVSFVLFERRHSAPFIQLRLLKNRSLLIGSLTASWRMFLLSSIAGFLLPLYLRDVLEVTGQQSSYFLMTFTLTMAFCVRWGGSISDKFGSRPLVMTCFALGGVVLVLLSRLSADTPHIILYGLLVLYGLSLGPILAAIHHAALADVPQADLGAGSGLYSMIRFIGSSLAPAVGGILLQTYKDNPSLTTLAAYQRTFLWFAFFALIGLFLSTFLPKVKKLT